ncbi:tetratricopeptide repeat-containing sensor histidine kinase [Sphingobacterium thalpophilum]|uniref:tetratricopeptide repeat-containing sensor histidine kinase n=1 Tax=Sphingobacterium thalpophilum TaxID=259 RepID=UPI0024A68FD4|nr:tetratricopeptide repeat protein [Sphingobacterium thalpophilum]
MKSNAILTFLVIVFGILYGCNPPKKSDSFSLDTAHVNQLTATGYHYWSNHPDSTILLSEEALGLSERIGYTEGKIKSLQNLGIGSYEKGKYSAAIGFYNRAASLAEETKKYEKAANILANSAMPYISLGNHTQALRQLNKAIGIAKKYNFSSIEAHAMHNIGMVYHYQKKDNEAIKYYNKSLKMYESTGDTSRSTFIFCNIGHLYLHKRAFKESKEYYLKALELAEKYNNLKALGNAQQSLGAFYLEQEDYKNALPYFLLAKQTFESTGEKTEYLRLLDNLTNCYLGLKDSANAYRFAQLGYTLSEQQGQLYYKQNAANYLSEILEKRGDLKQSLRYYKIYKSASDSLYSANNRDELVRQEENYKYEQKQSELEIKMEKRNYLLLAAGIVIISLLSVAFMLIRSVKEKKRNNAILRSTNSFIEEQNEQLEASDEFQRSLIHVIAHDFRLPLSNLKNILLLFTNNHYSPSEIQKLLSTCYRDIVSLSELLENLLIWVTQQLNVRKLSNNRFVVKEVFTAVGKLYEDRLIEKDISLKIDCDSSLAVFADQMAITAVVRNLLDNAIKFSEQNGIISLSAHLHDSENKVILTISDNGVGLSQEVKAKLHENSLPISELGTHREKGYGIGLLLCLHFLKLSSSKLFVDSNTGEGTRFWFELEQANLPD